MISVLLPVYNCEPFITDSIRSILNQSFKHFELLIIDDGSTDNTVSIIKQFQDKRIRLISIPHKGKSEAINYGLENSKYEIIIHMDGDDIAHPSLLSNQYNLFRKRSSNFWIGCNYAIIHETKKKIIYTILNPLNDLEIKKKLSLHGCLTHTGSIVRKSTILKLGGYKSLIAFEDYEIWLRGRKDLIFENNPNILVFVRYRKNSRSRDDLVNKHRLLYKIQAKYFENFSSSFSDITEFDELKIRGWREYFYGNKNKARFYWKSSKNCFKDYRLIIAYIISFLPDFLFVPFKEFRIRFRMEYCFKYFNKEYASLRKTVKEILN